MTWAQRLKRVFNIDIETCSACGGAVKVIASIEDSAGIQKTLTHLKEKTALEPLSPLPSVRAQPTGIWKAVLPPRTETFSTLSVVFLKLRDHTSDGRTTGHRRHLIAY
jgi:hypothetical protein